MEIDRSKERREAVDILEDSIDLFDLTSGVDSSDERLAV